MAYAALSNDAAKWNEHSTVMDTAAKQAASYGLTGFQFGYTANQLGVGAKYQEIQDLAVRLLSEGVVAMQQIADTLIKVRDDYEATDQQSGGRIEHAGGGTQGQGQLNEGGGSQGQGQLNETPDEGSGQIEDRTGGGSSGRINE
ncbi:hypothetical protein [Actinoplanes auranticolor]|uniref:hypothetical protein n=1 Tax=Actinoplanes auranticolor TaxID=47988 RepID=UPI001BB37BCB|nr:hypothetical protein [Actinoplanes auranticolor]